jgi:glycosyltransferase involved in cell wall biosynthesis
MKYLQDFLRIGLANLNLSIVMPVWNESEGIVEFITELQNSFTDTDVHFYIVNDCSTDGTKQQIDKLKELGISFTLHNNPLNYGHGPSTITALKLGVNSQTDVVISIDGDGQFTGYDVARLYLKISSGEFDIVEGNRINRNDPIYRNLASFVTRQLVAFRTGIKPTDANTPLRAYKRSVISTLVDSLPSNALVPNLIISAISRKENYKLGSVDVNFIPRRGSSKVGTTWGKSRSYLPSKKFITFCLNATREWIKIKI